MSAFFVSVILNFIFTNKNFKVSVTEKIDGFSNVPNNLPNINNLILLNVIYLT